jgi:tyrosyl-tRNA synthetase
MSKSYGNYIGLAESADSAFGKLMSISDTLMWRYFSVLLGRTPTEISQLQARVAGGTLHPMELKKDMAHEIIVRFWSIDEAIQARKTFEAVFQQQDYSQAQEVEMPKELTNPVWVADLLKSLAGVKTSSEAKRLVESKAVHVDGEVISDFKATISVKSGMVIKVGKHRIYRIK